MDPLRENKMKLTGRHEVVFDEAIGPQRAKRGKDLNEDAGHRGVGVAEK